MTALPSRRRMHQRGQVRKFAGRTALSAALKAKVHSLGQNDKHPDDLQNRRSGGIPHVHTNFGLRSRRFLSRSRVSWGDASNWNRSVDGRCPRTGRRGHCPRRSPLAPLMTPNGLRFGNGRWRCRNPLHHYAYALTVGRRPSHGLARCLRSHGAGATVTLAKPARPPRQKRPHYGGRFATEGAVRASSGDAGPDRE